MCAAAGLGQAAADQVADGQQGDEEPGRVGEEDITATVGVADQQRGDQHSGDCDEVDGELRRLECGLRVGAGSTENLNLKIKNTKRTARGYRNFAHYRLRLLLNHGRIREDHPLTRIRTCRPRFAA